MWQLKNMINWIGEGIVSARDSFGNLKMGGKKLEIRRSVKTLLRNSKKFSYFFNSRSCSARSFLKISVCSVMYLIDCWLFSPRGTNPALMILDL